MRHRTNGTPIHCKFCGKEFIRSPETKQYGETCNSCRVNRRRFKKRQEILSYKGGSCMVCGYNRCSAALDLHHIDSTTKDFSLSGHHNLSLARLKAEADKCILLCRNCHAEVHSGMLEL